MDSQELLRIIAKDRWVAFATLDGNQPRVRMMTIRPQCGHLWCFTSAFSAKVGQLRRNKWFEFVANMDGEANINSLRAAGRAEIVTDPSIRKELASSSPSFKEHWQTPDDPDFMLLRLDVERVEIERGPTTKAEKFKLR